MLQTDEATRTPISVEEHVKLPLIVSAQSPRAEAKPLRKDSRLLYLRVREGGEDSVGLGALCVE